MGTEPCLSCAGTGRVMDDLWPTTAGCSSCGGSGRKAYCRKVRCGACSGRGYVDC